MLKPSGRLLLFSGFCSSCAVFSRAETTFTFPGMMSLCLCLSLIYLFTVIPSCTLPVLRPYSDPAADFKSTEVSLPVQSFLPSPSVLVSSHVFFVFFLQSDSYACRVNDRNSYMYIKLHVHFYMIYCIAADTTENWCENEMTSSGIFLSTKAHKGFWSSTTATWMMTQPMLLLPEMRSAPQSCLLKVFLCCVCLYF